MAEATSSSSNETFTMKIVLSGIKKRFSEVTNISPGEVQEVINDPAVDNKRKYLIFDVREKKEYNISHIEQANFIDESLPTHTKVEQVAEIIHNKLADDTTQQLVDVIVYCSIGYRSSALVSNILKSDEYKESLSKLSLNFFNMEGGIFQWANEDRPVVDSDCSKTNVVHPYNALWGKLLHKKHRHQGK